MATSAAYLNWFVQVHFVNETFLVTLLRKVAFTVRSHVLDVFPSIILLKYILWNNSFLPRLNPVSVLILQTRT